MESKTGKYGLQDELTAKMHSEFTISPETEIKHKAGCVWGILKWDATKEEIEHHASLYGITYEDCMKWKKHWGQWCFDVNLEELPRRLSVGQIVFAYDKHEEAVVKILFDKEEDKTRAWLKRKGKDAQEVPQSSETVMDILRFGVEVSERYYENY